MFSGIVHPHLASSVVMMLALQVLTDNFASRNFSIAVPILLFYSKMLKKINLLRVVCDDSCDNGTICIKEGIRNFFIV